MSAASKSQIIKWFDEGVKGKHTHMIVVCDTFDHEDYPVYSDSPKGCLEQYKNYNGPNMQRVMEVYDLKLDKNKQMAEVRAFHLPKEKS